MSTGSGYLFSRRCDRTCAIAVTVANCASGDVDGPSGFTKPSCNAASDSAAGPSDDGDPARHHGQLTGRIGRSLAKSQLLRPQLRIAGGEAAYESDRLYRISRAVAACRVTAAAFRCRSAPYGRLSWMRQLLSHSTTS